MKNQLPGKRIPTVLGIGFIILAVILTTFIVKSQTNLKINALNSENPQNIKVTNVSDNSFTLTYQTDALAAGSINYGRDKKFGNTEFDSTARNLHSITVKKLSPATKYFFIIISGQNTFLNSGSPFEISTAPNISSPSASQITVAGKIVLPDGNAPEDALVYLNTQGSQLLSSTVAKDGSFSFSLKSLRTSNFSSYFKIKENSVFELLAINNSLKSTVSISIHQAGSIPTITLSNDYDFTNQSVSIASKSAEIEPLGFPSIVTKQEKSTIQILTPKENQSFSNNRPQFSGTSLPNEKVQIIIRSEENIQAEVIADRNGNWTYQSAPLSPGVHTITIYTRGSSGILKTFMQSFTVLAAQAPNPTPTFFPSPTITSIPTSTPTPPITTSSIESKGGLPPTGISSFPLIIGGIVTTISALALFFLTRNISL